MLGERQERDSRFWERATHDDLRRRPRTRPEALFGGTRRTWAQTVICPAAQMIRTHDPAYMHEFSSAPGEPLRPLGPAETHCGRNPNSAALGVASLASTRTRPAHSPAPSISASMFSTTWASTLGSSQARPRSRATSASYARREPAQTRGRQGLLKHHAVRRHRNPRDRDDDRRPIPRSP